MARHDAAHTLQTCRTAGRHVPRRVAGVCAITMPMASFLPTSRFELHACSARVCVWVGVANVDDTRIKQVR